MLAIVIQKLKMKTSINSFYRTSFNACAMLQNLLKQFFDKSNVTNDEKTSFLFFINDCFLEVL